MWWQFTLFFIIGILFGAAIYHFFIFKRHKKIAENSTVEKELREYEKAVHHHLMQTTELLQQLGTDYQYIVEHLRHGIHELDKPVYEEGSVIPHFLFTSSHKKNTSKEAGVSHHNMPKTYVESPDKE